MTFELTMANLISLAGLFFGALWALLKVIGAQAERRANEKFAALQASAPDTALLAEIFQAAEDRCTKEVDMKMLLGLEEDGEKDE